MNKHIFLCETETKYESLEYEIPHVALTKDDDIVHYDPLDSDDDNAKNIPGSVVVVNNSTLKMKVVAVENLESYPKESWTPIGIVVIPASHDVYGNGCCGVMSLVSMSCNTPATGEATEQKMSWGKFGTNLSIPNLDLMPICGSTERQVINVSEWDERGYMASDSFEGPQCVLDANSFFINSSSSYKAVMTPYLTNGEKNPIYCRAWDSSSVRNCFSDFDGTGNTAVIMAARGVKDYSSWKPTYNDAYNSYAAASCCDMFYTIGTEQGDWYLPAMGELGYLCARLKAVNTAISAVKLKYNIGTKISANDYWSSSEYDYYYVWELNMGTGRCMKYDKDQYNYKYVRAFIQV